MAFKLIIFLILVVVGFFWFSGKTCLDVNEHFYHVIIDPALLRMQNDKYSSVVQVSCDGLMRPYPLAYVANGVVTYWLPDSSVKIARNRIKVCEGDVFFIGSDKCTIDKISKIRITY